MIRLYLAVVPVDGEERRALVGCVDLTQGKEGGGGSVHDGEVSLGTRFNGAKPCACDDVS